MSVTRYGGRARPCMLPCWWGFGLLCLLCQRRCFSLPPSPMPSAAVTGQTQEQEGWCAFAAAVTVLCLPVYIMNSVDASLLLFGQSHQFPRLTDCIATFECCLKSLFLKSCFSSGVGTTLLYFFDIRIDSQALISVGSGTSYMLIRWYIDWLINWFIDQLIDWWVYLCVSGMWRPIRSFRHHDDAAAGWHWGLYLFSLLYILCYYVVLYCGIIFCSHYPYFYAFASNWPPEVFCSWDCLCFCPCVWLCVHAWSYTVKHVYFASIKFLRFE